jgi:murein DD-endopeptidase MepM/ murein hydrolase activator NlpD
VVNKSKKQPIENTKKDKKLRIIISDNNTFEEKLTFSLSVINVIVLVVSVIFTVFVISFFTIIYTPLKQYVPGCDNKTTIAAIYRLNLIADSLKTDLRQKNLFIENIKRILNGEDTLEVLPEPSATDIKYDTIKIKTSKEDSIFRAEFENEQMFNLYFSDNKQTLPYSLKKRSILDFNFFVPVQGVITSKFNISESHYGVDIAAGNDAVVKATLSGTVIFANWTLATGHIVAIQHQGNIISVYKHCSVLLVKEGDPVEAGDPIAITGESGEQQTGPHLHFELWYNGTPTNPEKFIFFE